ncbi:hypothetical protein F9U64_21125 [Gracilibacillus oryzae]|uniref:Uncharacterized protein n=1 Tax=Gracilibacillus oryzae TaxID=1672701 RepID=A0A7C8KPC6_9BACI|nr:hypothetical protein [Gracilibacillus oryzae]KAB8125971.1 hypothetical protein F9U64_21125 [Gracilibacillus oryzae]
MDIHYKTIDRALFSSVFVGIVVFIKEFYFPSLHSIVSILITGIAAFAGYVLASKLIPAREKEKRQKDSL